MELIKKFQTLFYLMMISLIATGQNFDAELAAFKRSYEHEKSGKYTEAINALKEVYAEDSYEINLRLGWLNYQSGNFMESEADYTRALTLKPYSEEARFGLIYPKSAMGKWNEVISLYEQILENHPSSTYANYRLGVILFNQKQYEKAASHFQKVVDLYPFTFDSLIMLAWCKFYLGNGREAKVLFQKSLLFNPDNESALEGLRLIK